MEITKSIMEQARFIDDFHRHMKNVGEYYVGGGWGASGIANQLLREHSGPDYCMPMVLKENVVNYLLNEKYNISMPTENKLIAKDREVRAYMVFMDFEDDCYTFSTEKFYKNVKVPIRFFRPYEGKVPEIEIEGRALSFTTLTPALFITSKQAYRDEMREKDKMDIKRVTEKIENGKKNERERFYEETKELLNILFRD